MRLHPRYQHVARAKVDLERWILDNLLSEEEPECLTYAELWLVLSQVTTVWAGRAVADEREENPPAPAEGGGETTNERGDRHG